MRFGLAGSRGPSEWLDGILGLALVPLGAHLAFSWMGFNPTDDGFVLAYGRRILDGQVPHRDFISIRPVGSPLLHLPELLLAGDYVLYASRLVWWCELALIAWVWAGLLARLVGVALAPVERLALRLLVFLLAAHVAPPRAWHTVDGMLLASLGVALATATRPAWKTAGYCVLGTSALCKQNFAAFVLLAPILLGDWRRPSCWLAAIAPAVGYALVVGALGGARDLVVQLGARRDLVAGGVVAYGSLPVIAGVLAGALYGWLPVDGRRRAALAVAAVLVAPLGLLASAATGDYGHYARVSAYVLLGVAAGRATALLRHGSVDARRAALLALALAWASSVSMGYRTPAYASGILAALILLVDFQPRMPLVAVTAVVALALGVARTQVIYRERSAGALDHALAGAFPGGRGLWTNARTYALLADLRRAVDTARAGGRRYAILPDMPGYWAASPDANPLPIDWPQNIELHGPALVDRVTRAFEAGRGHVRYVVQKVRADVIATATVPIGDDDPYPLVRIVRTTMTKVSETEFFEIYE